MSNFVWTQRLWTYSEGGFHWSRSVHAYNDTILRISGEKIYKDRESMRDRFDMSLRNLFDFDIIVHENVNLKFWDLVNDSFILRQTA